MKITRLTLRALAGCAALVLLAGNLLAQSPARFSVTLLGTGSPPPTMDRFGPSTLVEAGDALFLFDAGRGTLQRLVQTGKSYKDVRAVFLTHLHSDHTVGLADLWLTGWLIHRSTSPLLLFGPEGTSNLAGHLAQAYAYDVSIRISDDHADPAGGRIVATEIQEGVVYKQDGVTITAFEVDHQPIKPAFGYRIDYLGHSVVLSGDTRLSENLVKWAKGADLLVHEVAFRTGETQATSRILAHHTLPSQAGEVFSRTAPRLAVFSHVDLSKDITNDQLVDMTRQTYKGPLVVGADLMSFDILPKISIHQPPAGTR
jgi:ribonuclease Z